MSVWEAVVLLLIMVAVCMPGSVMALTPKNDIFKTVHNLGITGLGAVKADVALGTETSEICVFCHTPHSASPGRMLWNQYSTTGTAYLVYSSPTVDVEINAIASNLPSDSISRLCLSCHDGTTGVNTLVNPSTPNRNPIMQGGFISFSQTSPYKENLGIAGPYLGTNLRNMHPIGFPFDKIVDTEIRDIDLVKGAGLKFFGSERTKMECPTCHDPHIYYGYEGQLEQPFDPYVQFYPFLRVSNSSSRLCRTCHIK